MAHVREAGAKTDSLADGYRRQSELAACRR